MSTDQITDAIQGFIDWREDILDTSPLEESLNAYREHLRRWERGELARRALAELSRAHTLGIPIDDAAYDAISPALTALL